MATKAWVAKMAKPQKFAVRYHNRCQICGRARGYYRDFGLCRICFRKMAHQGLIPGVKKSSW
ncbi:MAG: type Z 30S ribosomal protein S14 [Elusimicrobiaceae bacterium]|jgi:small subunit ribosomal protein S14|uniref:type Z 30S ribosomal protein S14 n=1 Tax=Candidatus Proelusimicrobium TaxID=3416175 RepID=UPI003CA510EE|nr:type Z 30S ribosomal protein S14 [Elusimicrobiaceae bacterium]MBR1980657.1 type Z 30S ribosomal protein S14 [Elusimicrobiaceae bacterium]MBR2392409.1 type Z 30S ribosomal protein S14 [Elusimicrobiaceae bacterium]MCR5504904.1 type Z 30S ribosomal protein S14 [Elusimicrobiaceae bacterium]MDD6173512.1 type Z 30S ribosomal protein S14 [Elusimicrobiota bacterium]